MPVLRYRSVEAMAGNTRRRPGDPGLYRAIATVWELAQRTTALRFPPGVYKHRSIEEAEALRREWQRRNFEAFHERRRRAQARRGDDDHE